MREKGIIKLHIVVDEESKKIVSIIQNNERWCAHGRKKFGQLVKGSAKKYE